jgi:hypothetical protein
MLYTQPAQCPNLTVNDLLFVNSLQSRYYRMFPKKSIELIEMDEYVYKKYPLLKISTRTLHWRSKTEFG